MTILWGKVSKRQGLPFLLLRKTISLQNCKDQPLSQESLRNKKKRGILLKKEKKRAEEGKREKKKKRRVKEERA